MRAVIVGYFGTLTDPGAEEYREPLAHRTDELLGGCRPRFWEALAGSFGERTIGVHGGTESTLRAVALSCGANPSAAQLPVALAHQSLYLFFRKLKITGCPWIALAVDGGVAAGPPPPPERYGVMRWRSRGKAVTSRTLAMPSRRATKRSKPMAQPPCGGMP